MWGPDGTKETDNKQIKAGVPNDTLDEQIRGMGQARGTALYMEWSEVSVAI